MLERLFRLLGRKLEVGQPEPDTCWAREEREVLLEEIRLDKRTDGDFFGESGGLEVLLSLLPSADRGFSYTREILPPRLLVRSDGDFRELTETGTEVPTRIKLTALGTSSSSATRRAARRRTPLRELPGTEGQGKAS